MRNNKQRKRNLFARILALIICVCLVVPTTVLADTLDDAKAKQAELADEKASLEKDLEALKDDQAKAEEYQALLQDKIEIVQKQIDQAIAQITALDDSIEILEKKIQKSEAEMQETIDLFQERVKALYKSGSTTSIGTLEILLNATSLSDMSLKAEAMKVSAEYNDQIMEKIQAYMEDTEDERTQLQAQKDEVAELKRGLDASSEELKKLEEENKAALANIKDKKAATEDLISENEATSAALQEEITALIAKKAAEEEARRQAAASSNNGGGSSGENNGSSSPDPSYDGSFNPCWPIPGVTYVSQYYGNNGHKGMDIAGPYGTPIVAAESGEVIMANSGDSWGDSWGYYVLIYHNGTFTTRYAHLSTVAVSTGQYVSKGTIIGYEGSTGNSTGPHLHFEVYQNGYRVDPRYYIGG